MKPVEKTTDVVINERTFRIKKFDAMTGSFMLFKITGILAPFVKELDLNKFKDLKGLIELKEDVSKISGVTEEISKIMAALGNLSESDFVYVQEKCLKVCSEVLPAGVTPILNQNGTFGVLGLEDDTMTVLALTAHALIFNVKGFFAASPLASLLGGLSITSPRA